MLNKHFATAADRLANYAAGQNLMKGSKAKSKVKSASIGVEQDILTGRKGKNVEHNPIVPNMADYVNWVLYDRNVFAAGANVPTNFKFFTTPIGTNSKTKVDTNLQLVSQLEQPYWMNVTHIGFSWMPNTFLTDIINFLTQSYFEFWVNNKVYAEGPHQCFPGNIGFTGSIGLTGTSAAPVGQQTYANGVPTGMQGMFDLRLPAGIVLGTNPGNNAPVVTDGLTGINILQSQLFRVEDNLPGGVLPLTAAIEDNNVVTGGVGLSLQAYLHGILSRSVS